MKKKSGRKPGNIKRRASIARSAANDAQSGGQPAGLKIASSTGSKPSRRASAKAVVEVWKTATIGDAKADQTLFDFPAEAIVTSRRDTTPTSASVSPIRSRAKAGLATKRVEATTIFQIFYEDWHEPLLDPDFEPYDNRGARSELAEFAIFETLASSPHIAGARHWGAVSWRFAEKTGISGKEWLAAVDANPGFDIYYCNPFPANEALFHNVWTQGEPSHPSFLALARAFFEAADLPLERLTAIQPSSTFSAANYLVGTPAFWKAYLPFVRRALASAEQRMAPKMRNAMHSKLADPQNYHLGSTYVPFIVERLLDTFLATDGAGLKACKIPVPKRDKELNVHTKLLREMKDVAYKTKSNWLAACWVNYRNLYLNQVNGREWCQKHLRNITPSEVKFI